MDTTDVITLSDAALIADVNTSTLRYAIKRKHLPATKFGKTWVVSREALQVWIDDPEMHKTGVKAK